MRILAKPLVFGRPNLGRYMHLIGQKSIPRIKRKNLQGFETSRTADQLSLHHDSQFSAFSTEALVRKNRDTIAVVLPLPL